jgi:hypothetical protein
MTMSGHIQAAVAFSPEKRLQKSLNLRMMCGDEIMNVFF